MNLTRNAKAAIALSGKKALTTGSDFIEKEHLLFGILSLEESTAFKALTAVDIPCDKMIGMLALEDTEGDEESVRNIHPSEEVKKVLQMAEEIMEDWGHDYAGTEHLVFAIFSLVELNFHPAMPRVSFFQSEPTFYINLDQLKREIFKILGSEDISTEPEPLSVEDVVRSLILKGRYADAEALCRFYQIEFSSFYDTVKESLGYF